MSTDTETVVAEPKAASAPKTRKARAQASRSATKAEKLVCRYCGSDDLAPSFVRRRDARCRACFKKHYGSGARGKQGQISLTMMENSIAPPGDGFTSFSR